MRINKDELEQFIARNRELFDRHEPSDILKQMIERKLNRANNSRGVLVIKGNFLRYAAAILLIIGGTVVFKMLSRQEKVDGPTEETADRLRNERTIDSAVNPTIAVTSPKREEYDLKVRKKMGENSQSDRARQVNEKKIDHYVRLIVAKQEEVAAILFVDPEINEAFAADFCVLNKEYDELKLELKNTSEVSQILEAIADNLEMQTALLNSQLEIYREYNREKG